jgi:hypothetical protein
MTGDKAVGLFFTLICAGVGLGAGIRGDMQDAALGAGISMVVMLLITLPWFLKEEK